MDCTSLIWNNLCSGAGAAGVLTAAFSSYDIIVIIDCFNIVLFSALVQTPCAHIGCDSDCNLLSHFFFFKKIIKKSTEVVYWQCNMVVAWLLLCRT